MSTAEYGLLDHRKNGCILDLKVDPVEKKLAQYKQKWSTHVSRSEAIR
jgi:hypothetical protein